MKIYYDTCDEKIYTSFHDLCEALHERYKRQNREEVSFKGWIDKRLGNGIYVYEVPDDEYIAYIDVVNDNIYYSFNALEEYNVFNKDIFWEYLNHKYLASEIYYMTENQRGKITKNFIQSSWENYFEEVGRIYKINIKSKQVKECFRYEDLWD